MRTGQAENRATLGRVGGGLTRATLGRAVPGTSGAPGALTATLIGPSGVAVNSGSRMLGGVAVRALCRIDN